MKQATFVIYGTKPNESTPIVITTKNNQKQAIAIAKGKIAEDNYSEVTIFKTAKIKIYKGGKYEK